MHRIEMPARRAERRLASTVSLQRSCSLRYAVYNHAIDIVPGLTSRNTCRLRGTAALSRLPKTCTDMTKWQQSSFLSLPCSHDPQNEKDFHRAFRRKS